MSWDVSEGSAGDDGPCGQHWWTRIFLLHAASRSLMVTAVLMSTVQTQSTYISIALKVYKRVLTGSVFSVWGLKGRNRCSPMTWWYPYAICCNLAYLAKATTHYFNLPTFEKHSLLPGSASQCSTITAGSSNVSKKGAKNFWRKITVSCSNRNLNGSSAIFIRCSSSIGAATKINIPHENFTTNVEMQCTLCPSIHIGGQGCITRRRNIIVHKDATWNTKVLGSLFSLRGA